MSLISVTLLAIVLLQQPPKLPPQAIVVPSVPAVDRGDARKPAGQSISGTILDEQGNPLKGATVSAWRLSYLAAGERRLWFEGKATSDQTGDYHIDGLKPGAYYVDAKTSESVAPTYFPGTANATSAALVSVSANNGTASVSIRLLSIPLAKVSGAVLNSQGIASAEFVVFLSPLRDDGAQTSSLKLMTEVDDGGKFVIDGVSPGGYAVAAVSKSRLERIAKTGSGGVGDIVEGAESGVQNITVDGANVDDLLIRTTAPVNVAGKITLDGSAITADLAKRLTLYTAERSGPGGVHSVMNRTFGGVSAEGHFTMPIVSGGRLLRVMGLPDAVTLQRVLVYGIDVTDEGFEVGNSDIREVVIALTSKPTHVTGRVTDGQGAPVAAANVIIFPVDSRHWKLVLSRVLQTVKTSRDGTFDLTGIPSGSYFAAAVSSLADGEWAEPAYLDRLRLAATSIKLSDGERKELTLIVKKQ